MQQCTESTGANEKLLSKQNFLDSLIYSTSIYLANCGPGPILGPTGTAGNKTQKVLAIVTLSF